MGGAGRDEGELLARTFLSPHVDQPSGARLKWGAAEPSRHDGPPIPRGALRIETASASACECHSRKRACVSFSRAIVLEVGSDGVAGTTSV